MAVIVWIVAWGVLHLAYRGKPSETRRALVIALVLVGVGVLGTFPTFFQAFAPDYAGRRAGARSRALS